MKKLLLILLCVPLIFSCGKITKEEVKRGIIKGCVEAADKTSEFHNIYKSKIKEYCECYANELIENSGFSVEEILANIPNMDMINKAVEECVDIIYD